MDTTITIKLQFDTELVRDLIKQFDVREITSELINETVQSFEPLVLTDKVMPSFIYKSLIREVVSNRLKSIQFNRLIAEKEAQIKANNELIKY